MVSGGLLVALVIASFLVGKFDVTPKELAFVFYAPITSHAHDLPAVLDTVGFQNSPPACRGGDT